MIQHRIRRGIPVAVVLAFACSDSPTGPAGGGADDDLIAKAVVFETQVGAVAWEEPWIECVFRVEIQARHDANGPLQLTGIDFGLVAGTDRDEAFDTFTVAGSALSSAFGTRNLDRGDELVAGWRLRASIPYGIRGVVRYLDVDQNAGETPFSLDCGPVLSEDSPAGVPTVGSVSITPNVASLEAGTPMEVTYDVAGPLGLWQTWLVVTHPLGVDTIRTSESLRTTTSRSVTLNFPVGTPQGSRLGIQVIAFDAALRAGVSSSLLSPAFTDATAPSVSSMNVVTWPGDICTARRCQIASDSIVRAHASAYDPSGLGHLIVTYGDPVQRRDSAAFGSAFSLNLPAPGTLSGVMPMLGYVSDIHGNTSEAVDLGRVNVFPSLGDSVSTQHWFFGATAGPAQVDFTGNRLFFAGGSSAQLRVIDLATLQEMPALQLGGAPGGLDITPDGSIIAAIPELHALEVRSQTGTRIERIDITALPAAAGYRAGSVVLTSDGTYLVALNRHDLPWMGNGVVVEIDPAAETQTIVADSAIGATFHYRLRASGDRSRVVVWRTSGCARVLDVASGSLGSCASMTDLPRANHSGSHWATGRRVYDADLVELAQLPAYDWDSAVPDPTDDRFVYVATMRGLIRVQYLNGLIRESRPARELYYGHLWVAPDGSRAVGVGLPDDNVNAGGSHVFSVRLR